MSYAVDFLIALICSIAAVLQIMQIKTTLVFQRYVGPDGQTVPADEVNVTELLEADSDIELEVFMTKSKSPNCMPPLEDGWERGDDRVPTMRSYVDASFGVVLAAAAMGLVLSGIFPTVAIAWVLFAAVAVEFAVDLPRIFKLLVSGQFSVLMLIPQAFMAVGLFAAYRLL